jgi:2-dehydro-3-deoxygalactonokinase
MPESLIGLDWGSTGLRAWLYDEQGEVLAETRAELGVNRLTPDADGVRPFEQAFDQVCGQWLGAGRELPVIAAGMVGSDHGWLPTRYRHLPLGLDERLECPVLITSAGVRVHVVPGVADPGPEHAVMRGEETELLGLPLDGGEHEVVMPGTHAKWVRVRDHKIRGIQTYVTGELFDLLLHRSSLAALATSDTTTHWDAFRRGLDQARRYRGNVLGSLFTARTLPLARQLETTQVADYLSGLLIGGELCTHFHHVSGSPAGPLWIVGTPALAERYARASRYLGRRDSVVVTDAASRGLWRAAQLAGILSTPELTAAGA